MDSIKGVAGDGQKQSSPPVDLKVGQVWTRGSERREIVNVGTFSVTYKFPSVTGSDLRNTGHETFKRWIRANKARNLERATLETNTDIPDHGFTPPWVPSQLAVGPQEGEWDTCEEGLTDDEYEGRHEPRPTIDGVKYDFGDQVVIEDDGHQD